MTAERMHHDDQRLLHALDELRELIRDRYPEAKFWVERAVDDPAIVHLMAEVDVEDTDEVADLVIDRMIDMQVDEGLPVYVIPVQTPERVAAEVEAQARRQWPRLSNPQGAGRPR